MHAARFYLQETPLHLENSIINKKSYEKTQKIFPFQMGFNLRPPFFALSVSKYAYITYVHTFSSLHSFTHEEDREGLDDDHDQGENSSLHLHPHPIQ